jgi:hypothetical protein
MEDGLTRGVAAKAEPRGILIVAQLSFVIDFGALWFEDLSETVEHYGVCPFMWFPVPVGCRYQL